MAFISLFDDRAKPSGSRDPLGFESVWTYWGRKVVGNLTTVTKSSSNFAVALLGFYWANERYESTPKGEKNRKVLELFLRYEQLTAYLRYLGGDYEMLGIRRVKTRIESEKVLNLGHEKIFQILSNQAGYGLWGLYSTALQSGENIAAQNGIISGNDRVPTQKGRDIAELMIIKLGVHAEPIKQLLTSTKPLDRDELERLAKPFVKAISNKEVKNQLINTLMEGFGVPEREHNTQANLWKVTQALYAEEVSIENSRSFSFNLIEHPQTSPQLKQVLRDINAIETYLLTNNIIFEYCQTQDGILLAEVTEAIANNFSDINYLPNSLPAGAYRNRELLVEILRLMQQKEWASVIEKILDLNSKVMGGRGGGSWVCLENGKIKVKVRESRAKLKPSSEIAETWRYTYFLNSYRQIANSQLGKVV